MEGRKLLGARQPNLVAILLAQSDGRQDLRNHLLHGRPSHGHVQAWPPVSDHAGQPHRGKGGGAAGEDVEHMGVERISNSNSEDVPLSGGIESDSAGLIQIQLSSRAASSRRESESTGIESESVGESESIESECRSARPPQRPDRRRHRPACRDNVVMPARPPWRPKCSRHRPARVQSAQAALAARVQPGVGCTAVPAIRRTARARTNDNVKNNSAKAVSPAHGQQLVLRYIAWQRTWFRKNSMALDVGCKYCPCTNKPVPNLLSQHCRACFEVTWPVNVDVSCGRLGRPSVVVDRDPPRQRAERLILK